MKTKVTKVNNPTKGVVLQSKKFPVTEKWPNVIFAFETSINNISTSIEGIEIPEVVVNAISYVREDLIPQEVLEEINNKIQMEKFAQGV